LISFPGPRCSFPSFPGQATQQAYGPCALPRNDPDLTSLPETFANLTSFPFPLLPLPSEITTITLPPLSESTHLSYLLSLTFFPTLVFAHLASDLPSSTLESQVSMHFSPMAQSSILLLAKFPCRSHVNRPRIAADTTSMPPQKTRPFHVTCIAHSPSPSAIFMEKAPTTRDGTWCTITALVCNPTWRRTIIDFLLFKVA